VATGVEILQVESAQWAMLREPIVPPTEEGALALGALYLSEMRRITRRIVRAEVQDSSAALLLAGKATLFVFGAAEAHVGRDEIECRFPIVGGMLVASPGGVLRVVQRTSPTTQLGLIVTGYRPRLASPRRHSLRRWLFRNVQGRLHTAVSKRFLVHVARGAL
jgi:hypothetical protein